VRLAASERVRVGDVLTIGTGQRKEEARVAEVGAEVTLAEPLRQGHAAGVDVSDMGTGIEFRPATKWAHRSGEAVQALGRGLRLDRALEQGYAWGTPVVNAAAESGGYRSGPAPAQWFGGMLSARAGSMALKDASGEVVVDGLVYGSQQSSSSGNGTIASPELATLEGEQSQGGCLVVAPVVGRSRGRLPDGADEDQMCTDFRTPGGTALAAAAGAGAQNVKVASVAGLAAGERLVLGAGAAREEVEVAEVGSAGATTLREGAAAGAVELRVGSGFSFRAGQAVEVGQGEEAERGEVAEVSGGRGGGRLLLKAPLRRAHGAGAAVAGTGLTLRRGLAGAHAPGVALVTEEPTPGRPNRYR